MACSGLLCSRPENPLLSPPEAAGELRFRFCTRKTRRAIYGSGGPNARFFRGNLPEDPRGGFWLFNRFFRDIFVCKDEENAIHVGEFEKWLLESAYYKYAFLSDADKDALMALAVEYIATDPENRI